MSAAPGPSRDRLRSRRFAALLALVFLGGVVAAAVYGIGSFRRNASTGVCSDALAAARRLAPLAQGELAAFAVADQPLRLPVLRFHDADGGEKQLSDWHGRTVLLNLWATWCVPCRKEMPALDALEQKLGGAHFEVVAVNIDTRDPAKPRQWLRENGVNKLGYYADPSAKVFQELKGIGRALGMPTTLLVDPAGCEIGTLAGPAEWASADGLALVSAALNN